MQLASAAIYAALIPDLSFGTALYHCFVTASTVGYGDVAITTPEARLFACLHIVVSVSHPWLASHECAVGMCVGARVGSNIG